MARSRHPSRPRFAQDWSDYTWRVYRRTGYTPEEARRNRINLSAARGHRSRVVEGVRLREHQLRELRRAARGDLSESERVWVRRQEKRAGHALADTFRGYSPQQRRAIMDMQRYARRRYTTSHGRFRWDTDAPAGAPGFPSSTRRAGEYAEFLGGGDDYEGDLDWDEYPDLEDIDPGFLFYH